MDGARVHYRVCFACNSSLNTVKVIIYGEYYEMERSVLIKYFSGKFFNTRHIVSLDLL